MSRIAALDELVQNEEGDVFDFRRSAAEATPSYGQVEHEMFRKFIDGTI